MPHELTCGAIWYIPEADVKAFTPPPSGRPKAAPDANKRATGQIRGSNGASESKSGAKKEGKK